MLLLYYEIYLEHNIIFYLDFIHESIERKLSKYHTKQYKNFIDITISFCQAIFVVILKIPGIYSQQYKDLHMCVVKGTNIYAYTLLHWP